MWWLSFESVVVAVFEQVIQVVQAVPVTLSVIMFCLLTVVLLWDLGVFCFFSFFFLKRILVVICSAVVGACCVVVAAFSVVEEVFEQVMQEVQAGATDSPATPLHNQVCFVCCYHDVGIVCCIVVFIF